MKVYLQATEEYITPNSPGEPYERLLIWLASINEMLPYGKRLSDTEVQTLAHNLAEQISTKEKGGAHEQT